MKILFISNHHKKPININLNILLLILVTIMIVCSYGTYKYLTSPIAENFLKNSLPSNLNADKKSMLSSKNYKDSLNVYVKQIGELQIRLMDLDKQKERIQDVMKRQIVGKEKVPMLNKENLDTGKGGPLINDDLSQKNINKAITNLMKDVEARETLFNKMEAMMLKQSVLKNTLPTLYPVDIPYRSSSYGWRHDPILGVRAFHSGLDFSAATGEPIRATASGIVTAANVAPDYGKFIKINHGDGLETRYAHASKLLVSKGDIVQREQIIGLVGSTGRSTGPHLHYEIRLNGRPLDPRQYIKK